MLSTTTNLNTLLANHGSAGCRRNPLRLYVVLLSIKDFYSLLFKRFNIGEQPEIELNLITTL
jgi:hypothetical protein